MLISDLDDFWSIGGFLIGLAGLIAAIFFYYKGKNKITLSYHIKSTTLLTPDMSNIPGFKVTICDEPIKELVSTNVRFVNKGNQAIMPESFPPKAPLMITTSGKIFGMRYTAGDEEAGLCVNQDGQAVHINFDYLDIKSGFTITIWHTGSIYVLGKLINGSIQPY